MRLLLSMGLKPGGRYDEPLQPRLRILDAEAGAVRDVDAGLPLPSHHPPGDHAELTGATVAGDTLWQCSRTEVLELSWPDLHLRRALTHPLFHDLHHAIPLPGGRLAVAATGHDSVLVLGPDGALEAHHWLPGGRFDAAWGHVGDFRQVPFDATKPRAFHPNHLRFDGQDLWVTCLETREARTVDGRRRIPLPEGPPHDGRLLDGLVWFTTVNGHVIAVDPQSLARVVHLGPELLAAGDGLPGWCRAVEKVGDRLFVGMTMLRASRHRELLRQLVRGPAGHKRPTRVVEVDLGARRVVAEHPVGNVAGGTVYAIHRLPDRGSTGRV